MCSSSCRKPATPILQDICFLVDLSTCSKQQVRKQLPISGVFSKLSHIAHIHAFTWACTRKPHAISHFAIIQWHGESSYPHVCMIQWTASLKQHVSRLYSSTLPNTSNIMIFYLGVVRNTQKSACGSYNVVFACLEETTIVFHPTPPVVILLATLQGHWYFFFFFGHCQLLIQIGNRSSHTSCH